MIDLKGKAKEFIGYDPQVTAAASSFTSVSSLTEDLPRKAEVYIKDLFPFHRWILNYNWTWAMGDLIAGLTVGLVVVPQSMSYAKIATLPVEYGLYSSFVGVFGYALFATSKDVTIGPVAVMSLEVSKVIAHVQSQPGGTEYSAPVIATALAFITGFIVLAIGLLRLGWLVEFVPAPAVSGFMTGSALNIAAGQVPTLMGYSSKFDTRASTFRVIFNSIKYLRSATRDAAFGLFGLFFLYTIRHIFTHVERRARNPLVKRIAFFANTLRTGFLIILLTIVAWLHLRHTDPSEYDISVLETVPAGFEHLGRPEGINSELMGFMGPLIPVSTIILVLEHIAIAKSFGRVNNYKIDPNQELIAIGVTNTVGTLFGAYPATGSFSRSAIKSKAGVRTPLAGWVTGLIVLIALYALTGAFYWIPNAALAAVIIHAVGDLIAPPRQVYGFWKVSPIECIIWFATVIVTIFATIEVGVYTSVGASAALLLYRIAKPRGTFLGRVRLHAELDDGASSEPLTHRDVYVSVLPDGIRNPEIIVEMPPPGVIIFRFEEAFLYPNASYYTNIILEYARAHTRSGQDLSKVTSGDRPWNDPGPHRWSRVKLRADGEACGSSHGESESKPVLRAVVFDFSSVSNIDTTSVQNLVDLRRVLERYANREVEFHFATILSPWIKRALLAGGFGTGKTHSERPLEIAPVVPSTQADGLFRLDFQRRYPQSHPPTPPNGLLQADAHGHTKLLSRTPSPTGSYGSANVGLVGGGGGVVEEATVISKRHARFHLDLPSAVSAAVGRDNW